MCCYWGGSSWAFGRETVQLLWWFYVSHTGGPHLFPRSPLNQRLQTCNKISSCCGNKQLGELILGLEVFFFKYLFHRWDTGMFCSRHRSTHICCCCCYRPCHRALTGIQHNVFSPPSLRIYFYFAVNKTHQAHVKNYYEIGIKKECLKPSWGSSATNLDLERLWKSVFMTWTHQHLWRDLKNSWQIWARYQINISAFLRDSYSSAIPSNPVHLIYIAHLKINK